MATKYRLGVDVGGTHTDLVLLDVADGSIAVEKVSTTPANPALGIMRGIGNFAARGVDLGALRGTLFAVDGRPITPITGSRFPIGIANRCDIRVETLGPGVYPIFAVREAGNARAAFVLASRGAAIRRRRAGPSRSRLRRSSSSRSR